MLLGLVSVFFALGVVVLAVCIGSGAMGLCCGFVVFRCFVVGVFHVISLLLAEKYRLNRMGLNSGHTECQ
jgi:hypothetical protein